MKRSISLLTLILAAVALFATGVVEYEDAIDAAETAGIFTTFLAAVDSAGLTGLLHGRGPFTLLAPTDSALAELPDGLLDALRADPAALTRILLYHVIPADLRSGEFVDGSGVATMEGGYLDVGVRGGTVFVDGASIVDANIDTSTGVIHGINSVLVPLSIDLNRILRATEATAATPATSGTGATAGTAVPTANITDTLIADGRFSAFLVALGVADLVDALGSGGPFTVFAPTDRAFRQLPAGRLAATLADRPRLAELILYHVVPGTVLTEEMAVLSSVNSVVGGAIAISVDEMAMVLNSDATVVGEELSATNGMIHAIDRILVPPGE